MEAAVSAGLTNPTCTSQKAVWIIPAEKTVIGVTPISSLDIEVHEYGKQSKYQLENILKYNKNNAVCITKEKYGCWDWL